MTQHEIKTIANRVIGDGNVLENLYFTVYGPVIYQICQENSELSKEVVITGFTVETDTYYFGPYDNYEEAESKFNSIQLDEASGIGYVYIEDRSIEKIKKEMVLIKYGCV